jgi:Family of unknown function (DUF5682)
MNELDPALWCLDGPVVFFPIRHHSPAAARFVSQAIQQLSPAAILIEGPSDFNGQLTDLFEPHHLPIAIYSYVSDSEGRKGAFYPFCIYSPEWQALQLGRKSGAQVAFIDLPWAVLSGIDGRTQRYTDDKLRSGDYVGVLCERFGVENFDDLWDTLIEIDDSMELSIYLERCHRLCYLIRANQAEVSICDQQREAFMAEQILNVMQQVNDPVLVVTGGFHSHALYLRLQRPPMEAMALPVYPGERGLALTPYSYERLDSLTGYASGMPGPGFYHRAWESADPFREMLALVVADVRRQKQTASVADVIAVETTARALAALRGHRRLWRQDLVDGITAALIKDELAAGLSHPFLDAVQRVLRGQERGRLAHGTRLPPLVSDIGRLLAYYDLEPTRTEKLVALDLTNERDRIRSRILHQLRVLGIAGFERIDGTDWLERRNLERFWEQWRLIWSLEFEANTIEASPYGPTLPEAAHACLVEAVNRCEDDAVAAARLLLDAVQIGAANLEAQLLDRLTTLLGCGSDFFDVTAALGHLLYLYWFDAVFGTARNNRLGTLLVAVFERSLWLMENLGVPQGREAALVESVRTLALTFERCQSHLQLDHDAFVGTLSQVVADRNAPAVLAGAACGQLWTLAAASNEAVAAEVRGSATPERIGDFLAGLFALGREVVQRHPPLLTNLDALVCSFDQPAFMAALPALRLAFTYFTPREKHQIVKTLFGKKTPPQMQIDASTSARATALEETVYARIARYGLRGGRL